MSTQSENSLMKKTKKELIDIILRKDDFEAKLRKELDDTKLDFSKAKSMLSKKDVTIKDKDTIIENITKDCTNSERRIEALSSNIKENDVLYKHLETKYNKMKTTTIVFGVIAIISLILLFVF